MKKVDMIIDLQYGSTGKGLIAGYLATKNNYDMVINANMPNAGHCQKGDTPIWTKNGILPLVEVAEGMSILNMDMKNEATSHFHSAGEKTVNKIELNNGIELECTPEHKYFVWDGGRNEKAWVESRDLDPSIHQFLFNRELVEMGSDTIPVDMAELLGQLVSDGCYDYSGNRNKTSLAFFDQQLDAGERAAKLLKGSLKKVKDKRCYVVETSSFDPEAYGLAKAKGSNKTTPRTVMMGSAAIRAAYIKGLFDGDGTVTMGRSGRVKFCNTAKSVVYDAQQILYSLGIHSKVREEGQKGNRKILYVLAVASKRDLTRYCNRIGFSSGYKTDRLMELVASKRGAQGQVVIVHNKPELRKSAGITATGPTKSRNTTTEFIRENADRLPKNVTELLNYNVISIDSITVNAGTVPVYDITMPDTHSYIAAGTISHNTFIDGHGNTMIHKVLPNGIVSPECKTVMIGPGSVFSVDRLNKEMVEAAEMGYDQFKVVVHANAVILTEDHKFSETLMDNIGSTKQGSAAALIEKLKRNPDFNPTVRGHQRAFFDALTCKNRVSVVQSQTWMNLMRGAKNILAEGAQGFSLGINEHFYPFCTSRDCTPARFMADMGIPLTMLRKVIGTARVHPIRVGGTSGGCYGDQTETSWEALGLEVERTTVTKKIRRVFSFSRDQISDAIKASQPDEIFLNFCNYDKVYAEEVLEMIDAELDQYGVPGSIVRYFGHGPTVDDVMDVIDHVKIAEA